MKKSVLPVLLSALWISLSEFTRNEFLLKSQWTSHYERLGIVFPSEPVNGAIWGIWSLCFAVMIFFISKKFNLIQTVLLSWTMGFMMMWLVIGNMSVLPLGILPLAVPLSLLEVSVAAWIIRHLSVLQ